LGCTNGTFYLHPRTSTIDGVMRLPLSLSRSLSALAITSTILLAADRAAARATNAGQVTSAPISLRFGKVAVGQTKTSAVTITNAGSPSITIFQATVVGTGFSVNGLNLPLTLSSGERFAFRATFTPGSKGAVNGTLYLVSTASNAVLSIPLTGSGSDAAILIVTPATMNFGNVQLGSYAVQSGMLSATGSAVTVSSATSSNPEFTVSGLSLPITIPAGQNASFNVTFTPQSSGSASANLTFLSDASNPLVVETVSATPLPHTVGLSWNASTSQDVVGYNVYRSNVSGGPYNQINSMLDPSLNYTDTSVSSGNTYYYVATAVNSDNEESVYSNETQATIP